LLGLYKAHSLHVAMVAAAVSQSLAAVIALPPVHSDSAPAHWLGYVEDCAVQNAKPVALALPRQTGHVANGAPAAMAWQPSVDEAMVPPTQGLLASAHVLSPTLVPLLQKA
jgi:hypothetical protein